MVILGAREAHSVHRLSYGLDNWGSIPSGAMMVFFSLCHHIQAGFGAHPVCFPMGIGNSYLGSKMAEA